MRAPFLILASLYVSSCVATEIDSGPAHDVKAIHKLIAQYLQAVDTVDLNVLSQIWTHSSGASFIYPPGEERGYDDIQQHVFRDVMGGMFSVRDLRARDVAIHVNGKAAWAEFHWTFQAKLRKDGSTVTTKGVETQIYRKEAGKWRLVHVHYSEDRQSLPSS